ncbi:MAG: serine hydrolase [Patescibacteria group bacterium]|jgi:beta-lactamase class A
MRINKNQLLFLFTGIFVGFLVSLFLNSPSGNSHAHTEMRKNQGGTLTNPLLDCDFNQDTGEFGLSKLKGNLNDLISQQISNKQVDYVSVYFRDLNNGPWMGINEKELFSPASLVKVPVMIAYFKEAETNPDLLQKKLKLSDAPIEDNQNIDPEVTILPNQEYTVDDLITRMIVYSDNEAYDILSDNIDFQKIINIYSLLGIDLSLAQNDPAGNIISVKNYASFYRILFNSSFLNQEMSEKALSLLTQTKYRDALRAGVPGNITVAHKFGERQYLPSTEKQLHDCGIVYYPGKPYLLCIMTRGYNFTKLANTIKEISAATYSSINQ